MPFKSKAQRRKFAQLLVDGKISDETYEEWNRDTGKKELPERLHPAPAGTAKRTTKTSRKRRSAPTRKRTAKPTRRRRVAAKR